VHGSRRGCDDLLRGPGWGSGLPQPITEFGRLSGRVRSALIHRAATCGASLLIACLIVFAVLSRDESASLARSFTPVLPTSHPTQESRHRGYIVGSQPLPTLGQLTNRANLARVGYVGVRVAGPVGAQVQLSEQLAHGTRPLVLVRLAAGAANVPTALEWRCDQRVRDLIANTMPPAAPQRASTAARTPSCAHRLAATIERRALIGGELTIVARDRWGIGGLALTTCTTPPGGLSHCRPWFLHNGQRRREIHIAAPRPGGWRVGVQTRYGQHVQVLVWAGRAGGRIRLLAAGDSEMQLLDDFLGHDLRARGAEVTSDARISTGLTNTLFFDWQSHARQQTASLRPDVTVMYIGANDGFAVRDPQGRVVGCCGSAWSAGYALLAGRMMRTYLRGNAGRVYWFVLPTPRPGNFEALFSAVNAGINAAARRFPGRVGLIDADAFFTPGSRYRDFMTYHGHGFVIHESDGIHLSTAADEIAASLVVRALRADRVIR
jgi:hypothetical protein